jgi:hypothetical protein
MSRQPSGRQPGGRHPSGRHPGSSGGGGGGEEPPPQISGNVQSDVPGFRSIDMATLAAGFNGPAGKQIEYQFTGRNFYRGTE